MFERLILTFVLGIWIMCVGAISYGFGDYNCTIETWAISFSLPVWSILTIGLLHDIGRMLFGTKNTSMSDNLKSVIFILWMSSVFTYVTWVHINLQATYMMLLIPLLSISLYDWLIREWSETFIPTKNQLMTLGLWAVISYPVYWILTFAWIILRVRLMDLTSDGALFYIQ